MRLSNLIFPLVVIGMILLMLLPSLDEEPCIEKETRWCDAHQKNETRWKIDGHWYLVRSGEIVGLYSRHH